MNPYRVLGVRENAPDEVITKTYRRLARRYHPDLNPDNAEAAERMGEINRAYEEIRSLRQQGLSPRMGKASAHTWDPEADARRKYTYYYKKPRVDPMFLILAAVVMFFLVRLILTNLFGGA